jgi:hypothetical protein
MTLTEVRCCCDPLKLLGYLPSPPDGGAHADFTLAPVFQSPAPGPRPVTEYLPGGHVRLSLCEFAIPDPEYTPGSMFGMYIRGLAYRADGVELETLQRIPGFLTAVPEYSNA